MQAKQHERHDAKEVKQGNIEPFIVEVWWPRPCANHNDPRCANPACKLIMQSLPRNRQRVMFNRPERILALSAYDAQKHIARTLNMPQSMWNDGTFVPTVIIRATPLNTWVAPKVTP